MPAVSVTLVLYQSAAFLSECLASLRADVEEGDAEVIAVDNASPDESTDIVARELPAAQLVRAEANRGFAAGANLGWPLADAPYWLLLNPDVVVPEGGLRRLVAWMDKHPEIGAASPEIVGPAGDTESPGRALPSLGPTLLELSRLHHLLPRRTRARMLRGPYWTGGDQLDAGWVPGMALIARREAVQATGLLSEDFFMYGEDIEWCWRLGQAGWRIGVCSEVAVSHREGSSAGRRWSPEERQLRMAEGTKLACRRIHGPVHASLYSLATAASLTIEGIHPARTPEQRRRARSGARAWLRAPAAPSR